MFEEFFAGKCQAVTQDASALAGAIIASGKAAEDTLDVAMKLWRFKDGDAPFDFAVGNHSGHIKRRVMPSPYTKRHPIMIRTASRDAGLVKAAQMGWPAFLGVLGAGFDSIVNARANTLTFPPGTAKYVRAMLRELGRFTPIAYRLELEHQTVEISGMLIAVGNGSTYGGGMKVCPGADVRDGVAEILIVGELPKLAFLRLFPKVFSGAHVHHPVTRVLQSAAFTLHAPGQTAWADGEYIGPTPVRLQVEPLAVRIIGAP